MEEKNPESKCIEQVLEKIIESEQLSNYTVTNCRGCRKGDNFIGVVDRVTVRGERCNSQVEINLIFKHAPTLPERRQAFNCAECFKREFMLYEEILPMFSNFEAGNEKKFKYAKLFATCKKEGCELLVLEDLKVIGYDMKNRREQFHIETYKAVMRNLAHLHSFSFALKIQQPNKFRKYCEIHETVFCERFMSERSLTGAFDRVYQCLDDEEDQTMLEKVRWIEKNFVKCLDYCVSSEETKKYGVIGHGDTWTNNVFLNYTDSVDPNVPSSVCFVDWQVSRYASPVLDIVYYIYASTDAEFRASHMEELYEEYYKELIDRLLLFGVNQEVFNYRTFRGEIEKFRHYGALTSILLLGIFMSGDEETFDSDEIVQDRTRYNQVMLNKAKHDVDYRKRMKQVLHELSGKTQNELVPANM